MTFKLLGKKREAKPDAHLRKFQPGQKVKLTSGEDVEVVKNIRDGTNYRVRYADQTYLIHRMHISHALSEEAPVNSTGAGVAGMGGSSGEPGVNLKNKIKAKSPILGYCRRKI